jgi:hypothetical protein
MSSNYKLIGTYSDNGKKENIFFVISKNCVYITKKTLHPDRAYDNCLAWMITEKSAIEYCKKNLNNFKLNDTK